MQITHRHSKINYFLSFSGRQRTEIGATIAALRFEHGWSSMKLVGQELGIPIDAYSGQIAQRLDIQRIANSEKHEERKVAKHNRAFKAAIARKEKGSDQYAYGTFESETPV